MEALDKLVRVLYKVLKVALCIVLIAMVAILAAHVVARYILNNSLTWSEELLKDRKSVV